jgi:hypothetical protein
MTRNHNIGPLADQLGQIKFEIAALEAKAAALKVQFVEAGPGSYIGSHYIALVESYWHTNLDVAAAKRALGGKWVREHSTEQQVTAVRCVHRRDLQGKDLRALRARA